MGSHLEGLVSNLYPLKICFIGQLITGKRKRGREPGGLYFIPLTEGLCWGIQSFLLINKGFSPFSPHRFPRQEQNRGGAAAAGNHIPTSASAFLPAGVEFCISSAHPTQDTERSEGDESPVMPPWTQNSPAPSIYWVLSFSSCSSSSRNAGFCCQNTFFLPPPSSALIILIFHLHLPAAFPCPTHELIPPLQESMLWAGKPLFVSPAQPL